MIIKFVPDTEVINYFGINLTLPKSLGIVAIAIDRSSRVCAFTVAPSLYEDESCWENIGECYDLGYASIDGDWRQSLIEIF